MKQEIIAQGAEAILTKKGDILEKKRIKKSYRIEQLDKSLREKRTKLEERIICLARRAGVPAPKLMDSNKPCTVKMQFVEGNMIRNMENVPGNISEKIGENIAKLHRHNIIHGDLTTSNMILANHTATSKTSFTNHSGNVPKNKFADTEAEVVFIDFGLAFISTKEEDKAVDLELLKQALASTHTNSEEAWEKVLKAYSINYNKSAGVLQRLTALEKRGRYKRGKH